jgi:hypothetical protein
MKSKEGEADNETYTIANEYRSWIEKDTTLKYMGKDNDMTRGSVTHNAFCQRTLRHREHHTS